jgi:hypothetical protein
MASSTRFRSALKFDLIQEEPLDTLIRVGKKIYSSLNADVRQAIESLGIFISTIGATLIESRLKENGKGKDNDNYAKPGLTDDTKMLIKTKIDDIENLTVEDVNTLTAMIMTLHRSMHKNPDAHG